MGRETNLAEHLVQLRAATGLSRREVVARSFVTKSNLRNYERGRRVPRAWWLHRLLQVYDPSRGSWWATLSIAATASPTIYGWVLGMPQEAGLPAFDMAASMTEPQERRVVLEKKH